MKKIKNLIITGVLGVIVLGGITTETNAGPRIRIGVGHVKVIKPGPNYVWVDGHYKRNAFGKLVWVPGHWKRI